MTWKSYAAVSGATVLAGWLASAPPSNVPARSGPAQPRSTPRTPAAGSDIEEQAARLQTRMQQPTVYSEPSRNPFRFGAASPSLRSDEAPIPRAPAAPAPLPPPVSLSGIAEDQVEGRVERTAVLSSPAGVLLVREGDDVLGEYRVAAIESDAVILVKVADGSTMRLSLSNPKFQIPNPN
jgi:hypothetical protein